MAKDKNKRRQAEEERRKADDLKTIQALLIKQYTATWPTNKGEKP